LKGCHFISPRRRSTMVLSGRESLIQLIGKRRRFLPNRHSILSDPIPLSHQQPEQPTTAGNDTPENDVVICPVCSLSLLDDNRLINSHLGNTSFIFFFFSFQISINHVSDPSCVWCPICVKVKC